jgi:hypothetical protein
MVTSRHEGHRIFRERLESHVKDDHRRRKAIPGLLRLSWPAGSGSGGRRVRREDVYGASPSPAGAD